jgi:CHAD domain-containing protein
VFAGFFHVGRMVKIRKKLKRLMDRCAEVRDCDIALELLGTVGFDHDSTPARETRDCRAEAEQALLQELREWQGKRLAATWAGELFTPEAVDAAFDPDLTTWIKQWFAHGRKAAASKAAYDSMHEFRLEGKRLRYTIELLSPLYKDSDAPLEALRELQTCLGELNDCVTALDLLEGHNRAARAMRKLLKQREDAFRALWKKKFGKRRQSEWTSIFSATAKLSHAGRPSRKPAARSLTKGAVTSAA